MREIWKAVKGFSGYDVSNLGRVRSYWRRKGLGFGKGVMHYFDLSQKPKLISPNIMKLGYIQVFINGKHKLIHRLVLESFTGECPDKYQAAHLNGKRGDNRLTNLQWTSRKVNCSHRILHGTHRQGSMCSTKLTERKVGKIKSALSRGVKARALATEYGVAETTISSIKRGNTWKHVKN